MLRECFESLFKDLFDDSSALTIEKDPPLRPCLDGGTTGGRGGGMPGGPMGGGGGGGGPWPGGRSSFNMRSGSKAQWSSSSCFLLLSFASRWASDLDA